MYKEEKKIDNSLTSKPRKWLLKRYARKVSKLFHPTTLNIMGLIGFVIAGLCFFLSGYNKFWLIGAVLGVFIHLVTDEFDGEVARLRGVASEHGYYLDHMLDMVGILAVFLGIGFSPLAHLSITLLIVILFYIIAMGVFLTTYVVGNFQISFAKVGPREGQLAIILFALISMIFKYPLNLFNSGVKGIGAFTLFDIVGLIAIFILIVVAVHSITDTISYLKRFEKTYKVNSFLEYIHKTQFMRNLDKDHPVKKMNKDLVNLERKIYRGNKK